MTIKHVSSYKGDILRKAAAKAMEAAKKPKAKAEPSQPQQTAPAPATDEKKATVEMEDVLTLRALLDRVEAGRLWEDAR